MGVTPTSPGDLALLARRAGPRLPALLEAWLSEAACTANRERAERASRLTPDEPRMARPHEVALVLACCRACPGVRALRKRGETPAPRRYAS